MNAGRYKNRVWWWERLNIGGVLISLVCPFHRPCACYWSSCLLSIVLSPLYNRRLHLHIGRHRARGLIVEPARYWQGVDLFVDLFPWSRAPYYCCISWRPNNLPSSTYHVLALIPISLSWGSLLLWKQSGGVICCLEVTKHKHSLFPSLRLVLPFG